MNPPLNAIERTDRLFKLAEKLGMDGPSEGLIADAINDAEYDTLHHYEVIAARHDSDAELIKSLLAKEKTKRAKKRRWARYLHELDNMED